ncbi:unnamed protein product [Brassicogethes aeneus]|uniref:C2 domain-containing protein n=1 Tax=Brassicogethes aeneus TaxID=1431903 RepID=A0A9P0FKC8_BRAAE|nr:unnamed protein product [Brassicogethes aeneus]
MKDLINLMFGVVPYLVVSLVVVVIMALLVMAALNYHCSITWRWLKYKACGKRGDIEESEPNIINLNQTSVQISHSLPDLQAEAIQPIMHDIKETTTKKVLRQTTLPIVPERLQTFQRQLSHKLDIPNDIKFSICSLERSNSKAVGNIKPELYKKDLVRQASVESSSGPDMEYCGKLHFSLRYDKEMEGLVIKILECRDLPIKGRQSSCDPYVRVFLLPDRKKNFQTKVKRKNNNPMFNESFIFSVTYEELRNRYIQFSIYDFDRFSKHDLIGHVIYKGLLDIADLYQDIEYSMSIMCPPQENSNLGELLVSLCYLPIAGRLTVTIIKGHSLKTMDITGKSDPYVKIYLLCQSKKIKKKKTSVKFRTLDPMFREAFVFDVPQNNIEDVYLVLKIMDYDRISHDETMGYVVIGSAFMGSGRDHWLIMLDNPRTPSAQWYSLMENLPSYIPPLKEKNVCQGCLTTR